MSNYKRKEILDYLTRKPSTTEDIELARTRIQIPVTPLPMQDASNEDLGFATGGVVSREAFKYGTSLAFKEFLEKQILKNKINYNSLDELIDKSNTNINQENAIKVLKNEYPDSFKIKVEKEYFPIHENPKETLKAIEGFKKLKEWEKNPTAENWFSVFRVTEPSGKTKPSKFSQGLRNYVQGKEGEGATFNKYFDKIELDEKLYNEIKTYDKDLANTLKAKAGNQAAKKAIFEKSDQAINDINEQFKFDPNSSLEEITEALYGNQFKNADSKNKLILTTQTSDDVAKYLKVLQGARPEQAKKIKLPDQETMNDIVDNIAAGKKGGFRFQEGTLRQYKFDIRDTLLGLEAGTSSQLRSKVLGGGKRVIDESVGLSATYERAPGYTEASQFLSPETNRIKGVVIDRPFNKTLDKALEGDLSGVKEYNKIARQFKKEYPDADVPIIEIGKNPKEVIKYFDSFSKESQKNILDIYNKSNISIRTNSKPLSVLVDEYQKAERLEGKAKTTAFTALGLTSAGIANADEVSDLTPMESSVLPDLSKIKEVIQENPITSSALATAAPLATEKGRDIYGKIGKGLLKGLSVAGTPLGVATYEALGPGGLRESIQEGRTTEDIATDPFTYASLPFANIASQAVSNPALQKILSLGLPARAVGALTPIGLTTIGATTAYQGIKNLKEEIERRSLLTPEQRQQEDIDREIESGRLAETGQFAIGGRVGYKNGSDDPESDLYIPPLNRNQKTKAEGIIKITEKRLGPEDSLSKYKSYSEEELLGNIEAKRPNQLQSFSLEDYQLNTMPIFKPKDVAPSKSYSPMPNIYNEKKEGILELATGGRVGFKDGPKDPSKRKFIKGVGIVGALGVATKYAPELFTTIKQAAKGAGKILPKVTGMPEWFPSLVVRIEKEGKYMNKDTGLADNLKIKQLTIQSKTEKGASEVYTMIQHPNGDIVIEANVKGGAFDAPFELHYKPPKTDMDVTTGTPIKEPGEFNVMENRPRSTAASHHDADYEIEYDLVSYDQAISDVERAERAATGKRIDPRRVQKREAARKYVEENPYDDIVNRYGDSEIEYDQMKDAGLLDEIE
jgi:hypothetical protein